MRSKRMDKGDSIGTIGAQTLLGKITEDFISSIYQPEPTLWDATIGLVPCDVQGTEDTEGPTRAPYVVRSMLGAATPKIDRLNAEVPYSTF